MSKQHDTPEYLKPYVEAVDKYGGTFDATLWRSREGQRARFKTFCDFVDFNGVSILDVGCGIGDFAQYLIESDVSYERFCGIDAMAEMIETATSRSLLDCVFETIDVVKHRDFFQGYDWITFSGTLNAMRQLEALAIIDDAFAGCNFGVAFNFLSDQCDRDTSKEDLWPASRFDTAAMMRHAFGLSPLVELSQTYLAGHDATIIVRKPELPQ